MWKYQPAFAWEMEGYRGALAGIPLSTRRLAGMLIAAVITVPYEVAHIYSPRMTARRPLAGGIIWLSLVAFLGLILLCLTNPLQIPFHSQQGFWAAVGWFAYCGIIELVHSRVHDETTIPGMTTGEGVRQRRLMGSK